MAEIADTNKAAYSDHDVIGMSRATMDCLHHIGTTNPMLTEEEKQYLQYAYDVFHAIHNAHVEATKQEPQQQVVVAKKIPVRVPVVSGLLFRDGK